MPISVVWEDSGYYKYYSGNVTGTDMLRSIEDHSADLRFAQTSFAINYFFTR